MKVQTILCYLLGTSTGFYLSYLCSWDPLDKRSNHIPPFLFHVVGQIFVLMDTIKMSGWIGSSRFHVDGHHL